MLEQGELRSSEEIATIQRSVSYYALSHDSRTYSIIIHRVSVVTVHLL